MNVESSIFNPGEIVDRNAFAGSWPFRFLDEAAKPAMVEKELRAAGIGSAWISPLDALFNAEPYSVNEWLIHKTAESRLLQAVPVFNPRLSGTGTELEKLLQSHPEIPAVRLVPGYHGYEKELNGPEVHAFIAKVPSEKTILISLRVQDRRGQPPLFLVPDVSVDSAVTLATAFPQKAFLLCGIRLAEVTSGKEKWDHCSNLHIETSFLDNISGMADCAEIVGDDRLHLGTLAPLFYASAAIGKVRKSGLSDDRIQRILTSPLMPSRSP